MDEAHDGGSNKAPRPFLKRGQGVEKRVFASRYRKPSTTASAGAGERSDTSGGAWENASSGTSRHDVRAEADQQHTQWRHDGPKDDSREAWGTSASGPGTTQLHSGGGHTGNSVDSIAISSRFLRDSTRAAWAKQQEHEDLELEEFRALESQITADVVGGGLSPGSAAGGGRQLQRDPPHIPHQQPSAAGAGGAREPAWPSRSYANMHQQRANPPPPLPPTAPRPNNRGFGGERGPAGDHEPAGGIRLRAMSSNGGAGSPVRAGAQGGLGRTLSGSSWGAGGHGVEEEDGAEEEDGWGDGQQRQGEGPLLNATARGTWGTFGGQAGAQAAAGPGHGTAAAGGGFDDEDVWGDSFSFAGQGRAGTSGGGARGRGPAMAQQQQHNPGRQEFAPSSAQGWDEDHYDQAALPAEPPHDDDDRRGPDQPFVRALFAKQQPKHVGARGKTPGKGKAAQQDTGPSQAELERMQALDEQLTAVASERSALGRMRTELEKAANRLEQERQTWERSRAEEQARWEAQKEGEEARLRRDRRVLEKQGKALLKLPNKKERSAMEAAEAALDAERREGKAREARHKLTVERLRRQLVEVQERNHELREEVRWHEAQQLEKGWGQQGPGGRGAAAAPAQQQQRPSRTASAQTDTLAFLPPLELLQPGSTEALRLGTDRTHSQARAPAAGAAGPSRRRPLTAVSAGSSGAGRAAAGAGRPVSSGPTGQAGPGRHGSAAAGAAGWRGERGQGLAQRVGAGAGRPRVGEPRVGGAEQQAAWGGAALGGQGSGGWDDAAEQEEDGWGASGLDDVGDPYGAGGDDGDGYEQEKQGLYGGEDDEWGDGREEDGEDADPSPHWQQQGPFAQDDDAEVLTGEGYTGAGPHLGHDPDDQGDADPGDLSSEALAELAWRQHQAFMSQLGGGRQQGPGAQGLGPGPAVRHGRQQGLTAPGPGAAQRTGPGQAAAAHAWEAADAGGAAAPPGGARSGAAGAGAGARGGRPGAAGPGGPGVHGQAATGANTAGALRKSAFFPPAPGPGGDGADAWDDGGAGSGAWGPGRPQQQQRQQQQQPSLAHAPAVGGQQPGHVGAARGGPAVGFAGAQRQQQPQVLEQQPSAGSLDGGASVDGLGLQDLGHTLALLRLDRRQQQQQQQAWAPQGAQPSQQRQDQQQRWQQQDVPGLQPLQRPGAYGPVEQDQLHAQAGPGVHRGAQGHGNSHGGPYGHAHDAQQLRSGGQGPQQQGPAPPAVQMQGTMARSAAGAAALAHSVAAQQLAQPAGLQQHAHALGGRGGYAAGMSGASCAGSAWGPQGQAAAGGAAAGFGPAGSTSSGGAGGCSAGRQGGGGQGDKVVREVRTADGKVERTYASGRRVVLFANGTRKISLPDGTSRVYFTNGDIKWTVPPSAHHAAAEPAAGTASPASSVVHYYYAEVSTWHATYGGEGGVEVFYFPSGQTEAHHPGRIKEILFPDGVVRVVTPEGEELDASWQELSWAIRQPQPSVDGLADEHDVLAG